MWNEMCNFVSKVIRGDAIVQDTNLSIYASKFSNTNNNTSVTREKSSEERKNSLPVPFPFPSASRKEKEEEVEKQFLITLRVLVFQGMIRKPKLITVQDETDYNQVRDEACLLLGIQNKKECVFIQATDHYGFWYHYANGLHKGLCIGRVQESNLFFHYDCDWFDVEDEISKHQIMLDTKKRKCNEHSSLLKRDRSHIEREEEDHLEIHTTCSSNKEERVVEEKEIHTTRRSKRNMQFISREDFNQLCQEYGYQEPNEKGEHDEVYEKCMKKLEKVARKAIEHALIITDNVNENVLESEVLEKVKKSVKLLK